MKNTLTKIAKSLLCILIITAGWSCKKGIGRWRPYTSAGHTTALYKKHLFSVAL